MSSSPSPTDWNPTERDKGAASPIKKLSKEQIQTLRSASLHDISQSDLLAQEALDAFFSNRVTDCENVFEQHKFSDPLIMCGSGLLSFLRYALSMEQRYADDALACIEASSTFSAQLMLPASGIGSKIASFYRRMKPLPEEKKNNNNGEKYGCPAEFRAKTIHTQSEALRAIALVSQQTVASYLKSGLALRRSFLGYQALLQEREERELAFQQDPSAFPEGGIAGMDINSYYSIDFGMGVIQIILSVMPDATKSMLNFFGMNGDRTEGAAMVLRCLQSNTLLSPFASAVLIGLHAILPGGCSPLVEQSLAEAQRLADEAQQHPRTKSSLLHLWLIGRVSRLGRDIPKSIQLLDKCLGADESTEKEFHQSMVQLRDFVLFDQTANYLCTGEWKGAIHCFELITEASKWSTLYYTYVRAACYEMLAAFTSVDTHPEEHKEYSQTASLLYWRCAMMSVTKLGGKPIAIDQFLSKRLEEMFAAAGLRYPNPGNRHTMREAPRQGLVLRSIVPLPAYELVVLSSLTHQLSSAEMDVMISHADEALHRIGQSPPDEATRDLAKSVGLSTSPVAAAPTADLIDDQKRVSSLPEGHAFMALLTVKACLLANSIRPSDRQEAARLISVVLQGPRYKEKSFSLSYLQPFALYEKACLLYKEGDKAACRANLEELKTGHKFFFHRNIELKAHLLLAA